MPAATHPRVGVQKAHHEKPVRHKPVPAEKLSFWLAALVILTSLAVSCWVMLTVEDKHMKLLFGASLCCFALAMAAGLIFTTRAQLTGNLGGIYGFTVGGPAAVWLIAFVIMSWFSKGDLPESVTDLRELGRLAADVDKGGGWKEIKDWTTNVSFLFEDKEEETNLRYLLSAVFLTGEDHKELEHPEIDVLFCYPDTSVGPQTPYTYYKLQRIRSRVPIQDSEIYVNAVPTLSGGRANAYLFQGLPSSDPESGGIEARMLKSVEGSIWHKMQGPDVDVLIVARYEEQRKEPPSADWILLHVPKYLDKYDKVNGRFEEKPGNVAEVHFGVIAAARVVRPKLWELRAAEFPQPGTIPVLFRSYGEEGTGADSLARSFEKEWLPALARFVEATGEEEPENQFIREMLKRIAPLRKAENNEASFSYEGSNALALTFEWRWLSRPVHSPRAPARQGR